MIGPFTRLDLRNLGSTRARLLGPLLLVVVIAVATPFPLLAVPAGVAVATLTAPTPFLTDERGRLDVLYATLPLRRRDVVAGRYLALLVTYLVTQVVASVLAVAAAALRDRPITVQQLVAAQLACLLAVALALAVQLPFFFAVGFTRARALMYLPVVALGLGVWLAGRSGLLDEVTQDLAASSLLVDGAGAALLAVVVLLVSATVSARLYRHRAL